MPLPPAADAEARLYARVTRRLIPLLFLCYVGAYLDRVNVGFAKLQMLADLRFSEAVYGLGAGIFFIGYFAFEVPSNVILHRVGARRWIARVSVSWAVVSACMAFVTTPAMFYALRFLLGVAEAGLFPGVILYLTYWFPSARRGRMIALFMTGIPIAGVIGGPLSGWILQAMAGMQGLAGWQWLFIVEALPSLALGVAVLLWLDDGIQSARGLSPDEKALLAERIADDRRQAGAHRLRDGFTSPRVWLLACVYFLLVAGLYGVGFWLPTLVRATGVASPLAIGLLTVVPNAIAAVAMVLASRSSDARRERRWHLVVPGVLGALGWVLATRGDGNTVLTMLALTLATVGVMISVAQFWTLPTALLAGDAAATGIAVVNSIGNLAGFASPYAVGWLLDRTGSTDTGILALAACMVAGSALVLAMPARLVDR